MRSLAIAIVVVGLASSLALGIASGFDAVGVVILALIAASGVLVVAVVNRSAPGRAGPATCSECDGVISPNAPYCKHCGARR